MGMVRAVVHPDRPSTLGAGTVAPRPAGASRPSPPRWVGWLAIAAVAAFPLAEAVRVTMSRSRLTLYGDQALLDLGVRRALQFDQLVGPYSRTGFHQPGPAVFYLLAPFVRIFEPAAAGLYFGAVVVNAAALIATVAILWHRHGPLVALWTAAAIDLFSLCVGVGTLREPWNPYLVVAPMVLFVVLWAESITGAAGAGLWTLVVASFLVQTHVATAGFAIVMSAVLLARQAQSWWRRRPRPSPRRARWTPAGLTGAVVLGLIWVAPAVEIVRDRPNNVQRMWDVFTSHPATPPLQQALRVAGDAATIMPFGYRDYDLALSRSGVELTVGLALIGLGLIVAVGAGWRRRQPASLALALAAGLGLIVGAISLTRTAGPVYLYFAVWMAFVPLAVLLAIGIAAFGRPPERVHPEARAPRRRPAVWPARPARSGLAVLLVVTASAAVVTVRSDLRMGPIATTIGSGPWPPGQDATRAGRAQTGPDTAALTEAAERVLGPTDRWVNITIGTGSLWPYAAGMVLGLDERGVQSTVAPASWSLYFGHERRPGRPVAAAFDLYASTDGAARRAARGAVVAVVDGAVLTYQRYQPHTPYQHSSP